METENKQYWQLAKSSDRFKKYQPAELWDKACEYFQWCEDHPWYLNEPIMSGERAGEMIPVPKCRPYTISGFCLFAGITRSMFNGYADGKSQESEQFRAITKRIQMIIYTQKLEGAMVGAFDANIVARELELPEHIRLTLEGLNIKSPNSQLTLTKEGLRKILNRTVNSQ